MFFPYLKHFLYVVSKFHVYLQTLDDIPFMKLLVVFNLSTVSKFHWSVSVRKPPPGKRFKYKLHILYMANIFWTCDNFHRQRTFVLRILFLPLFHPFLFNFASFNSCHFVHILRGLVREIKCIFSFFFFSKRC